MTAQIDRFKREDEALGVILFILSFAFLVYCILANQIFPSVIIAFYIGLNAVEQTRNIYAIVWRFRNRHKQ